MKRYGLALLVALMLVGGLVFAPLEVTFADECGVGLTLAGNALPNVINGGPNDDRIHGGGGDDTLRGLGCNDWIRGGAGDDHINGGPGFDHCDGGPGFDTFVNCEVAVQ